MAIVGFVLVITDRVVDDQSEIAVLGGRVFGRTLVFTDDEHGLAASSRAHLEQNAAINSLMTIWTFPGARTGGHRAISSEHKIILYELRHCQSLGIFVIMLFRNILAAVTTSDARKATTFDHIPKILIQLHARQS